MKIKTQCILIYGNPVNGFAYVGPFCNPSDAHNYGEHMGYPEYWLTELVRPKDEVKIPNEVGA